MSNELNWVAAWRDQKLYSIEEAAALVLDTPPAPEVISELDARSRASVTEMEGRLWREVDAGSLPALVASVGEKSSTGQSKLLSALVEAQQAAARQGATSLQFSVSCSSLRDDGPFFRVGMVKPEDLSAWCKANGLQPAIFAPSRSQLGTLERESVLALLGVVCELAGLDLRNKTKGHGEARRLVPALGARGVRLTAETVAKYIAAARELINPQGPSSLADSNSYGRRSSSNH